MTDPVRLTAEELSALDAWAENANPERVRQLVACVRTQRDQLAEGRGLLREAYRDADTLNTSSWYQRAAHWYAATAREVEGGEG